MPGELIGQKLSVLARRGQPCVQRRPRSRFFSAAISRGHLLSVVIIARSPPRSVPIGMCTTAAPVARTASAMSGLTRADGLVFEKLVEVMSGVGGPHALQQVDDRHGQGVPGRGLEDTPVVGVPGRRRLWPEVRPRVGERHRGIVPGVTRAPDAVGRESHVRDVTGGLLDVIEVFPDLELAAAGEKPSGRTSRA